MLPIKSRGRRLPCLTGAAVEMADDARRLAEVADVLRGVNPELSAELDGLAARFMGASREQDPMTHALDVVAAQARREEAATVREERMLAALERLAEARDDPAGLPVSEQCSVIIRALTALPIGAWVVLGITILLSASALGLGMRLIGPDGTEVDTRPGTQMPAQQP